jgi:hypothetical protein
MGWIYRRFEPGRLGFTLLIEDFEEKHFTLKHADPVTVLPPLVLLTRSRRGLGRWLRRRIRRRARPDTDIHGGVFREYDFVAAGKKVLIDGAPGSERAHGVSKGARLDQCAHDHADEFESACASRHASRCVARGAFGVTIAVGYVSRRKSRQAE